MHQTLVARERHAETRSKYMAVLQLLNMETRFS